MLFLNAARRHDVQAGNELRRVSEERTREVSGTEFKRYPRVDGTGENQQRFTTRTRYDFPVTRTFITIFQSLCTI